MVAPARRRQASIAEGREGADMSQTFRSSPPLSRGAARQYAPSRAGPAAQYRHLAQIADALLLLLAFPIAYFIKTRILPADLTSLYDPSVYMAPAAIFGLAALVSMERRGAYAPLAFLHLREMVLPVLLSFGQALLLGSSVLFVFKLGYVSRLFVALYALTGLGLILVVRAGLRVLAARLRASGAGAARVLIVAEEAEGIRLTAELIREAAFGVTIVGRVDPAELRVPLREDLSLDGLLSHAFSQDAVDEVFFVAPNSSAEEVSVLIEACSREGIVLHLVSGIIGHGMERVVVDQVGDIRLLSLHAQKEAPMARAMKRVFDLVVAVILLALTAPAWPLIALAIRLDSRGPVFFRQERLGLNKRRFGMLKFRSMVVGADAQMSAMEPLNEADGPIFKLRRDPRVTRSGRFLRRFDVDELPQLLNVLAGHMSLIGPRPMLEHEILGFAAWQRKRFSVLPGITGLWQVSNRLGDPFIAGLEADLDYIDDWSWRLDLEILLRTIPAVLRDRISP